MATLDRYFKPVALTDAITSHSRPVAGTVAGGSSPKIYVLNYTPGFSGAIYGTLCPIFNIELVCNESVGKQLEGEKSTSRLHLYQYAYSISESFA